MMDSTLSPSGIGHDAYADFEINVTPVERIVRRTPLVGVGDYRCPVDHPQFAGGGPEKCPFIVFSRSSVRLIPSRGAAEVCTPNSVNLLDVGDSYARQPVSKEGAQADWIAMAPALLREIAGYVDPDLGSGSQTVFDRAVAPITSGTFLAQRTFFKAVQSDSTVSRLGIEESAIRLLERVLRETGKFTREQATRKAKSPRRTAVRMRETVEETKCILAREYGDNLSIAHIAERVHCSPGYLSRSFGLLSGFTLHGYQQQLRLRMSLHLLGEARFNGAAIAAQLGFANHSHFSDVFRRHFGITPSEFSRTLSEASLETMHALLDANEQRCLQQ